MTWGRRGRERPPTPPGRGTPQEEASCDWEASWRWSRTAPVGRCHRGRRKREWHLTISAHADQSQLCGMVDTGEAYASRRVPAGRADWVSSAPEPPTERPDVPRDAVSPVGASMEAQGHAVLTALPASWRAFSRPRGASWRGRASVWPDLRLHRDVDLLEWQHGLELRFQGFIVLE